MHKWTLVSAVLALGVFSAGPVLAQTCERATATYEAAVDDYLGAKFALDRATQLLASARYASIIGKMKINIALQETDVARALPGYIASLGPPTRRSIPSMRRVPPMCWPHSIGCPRNSSRGSMTTSLRYCKAASTSLQTIRWRIPRACSIARTRNRRSLPPPSLRIRRICAG